MCANPAVLQAIICLCVAVSPAGVLGLLLGGRSERQSRRGQQG